MPLLSSYVGLAARSEQTLAESLRTVGEGHADEPDVLVTCETLARFSDQNLECLAPIAERYGRDDTPEPERLHAAGVGEVRPGGIGLLRDLQDLHLLATLVQTTWTVIGQGAQGLRDEQLAFVAQTAVTRTGKQLSWLTTRMKAAAPQALVVPPPQRPHRTATEPDTP